MDDHAPKTTVRLTVPAPIIVGAMEQAGTMAQRAAERIQQGAIMDRLEAAGQLIDALGRDIYPGGNVPSTSAQRDWRTRLSDQIARLDYQIGRLVKRVEALHIPVVIAVTADHGGGDIPERLSARGYTDAGRLDSAGLLAALNAAVREAIGIDWTALRPAFFDPTQLVVVDRDGRTLADAALKRRIADAAVARAREFPGVAGAWTAETLAAREVDMRVSPDLLSVPDRMALSVYPKRSRDVPLAGKHPRPPNRAAKPPRPPCQGCS